MAITKHSQIAGPINRRALMRFDFSIAGFAPGEPYWPYSGTVPAGFTSPDPGANVIANFVNATTGHTFRWRCHYFEQADAGDATKPEAFWRCNYFPKEAGDYTVTIDYQDNANPVPVNEALPSSAFTVAVGLSGKGAIEVPSERVRAGATPTDGRFLVWEDGTPIIGVPAMNEGQLSPVYTDPTYAGVISIDRPWWNGSSTSGQSFSEFDGQGGFSDWREFMTSGPVWNGYVAGEGMYAAMNQGHRQASNAGSIGQWYATPHWTTNRTNPAKRWRVRARIRINSMTAEAAGDYGFCIAPWLNISNPTTFYLNPTHAPAVGVWTTVEAFFYGHATDTSDFFLFFNKNTKSPTSVDILWWSLKEVDGGGAVLSGECAVTPYADASIRYRPYACFVNDDNSQKATTANIGIHPCINERQSLLKGMRRWNGTFDPSLNRDDGLIYRTMGYEYEGSPVSWVYKGVAPTKDNNWLMRFIWASTSYAVARWGGYPGVFGFELMNEFNATEPLTYDLANRMAGFGREIITDKDLAFSTSFYHDLRQDWNSYSGLDIPDEHTQFWALPTKMDAFGHPPTIFDPYRIECPPGKEPSIRLYYDAVEGNVVEFDLSAQTNIAGSGNVSYYYCTRWPVDLTGARKLGVRMRVKVEAIAEAWAAESGVHAMCGVYGEVATAEGYGLVCRNPWSIAQGGNPLFGYAFQYGRDFFRGNEGTWVTYTNETANTGYLQVVAPATVGRWLEIKLFFPKMPTKVHIAGMELFDMDTLEVLPLPDFDGLMTQNEYQRGIKDWGMMALNAMQWGMNRSRGKPFGDMIGDAGEENHPFVEDPAARDPNHFSDIIYHGFLPLLAAGSNAYIQIWDWSWMVEAPTRWVPRILAWKAKLLSLDWANGLWDWPFAKFDATKVMVWGQIDRTNKKIFLLIRNKNYTNEAVRAARQAEQDAGRDPWAAGVGDQAPVSGNVRIKAPNGTYTVVLRDPVTLASAGSSNLVASGGYLTIPYSNLKSWTLNDGAPAGGDTVPWGLPSLPAWSPGIPSDWMNPLASEDPNFESYYIAYDNGLGGADHHLGYWGGTTKVLDQWATLHLTYPTGSPAAITQIDAPNQPGLSGGYAFIADDAPQGIYYMVQWQGSGQYWYQGIYTKLTGPAPLMTDGNYDGPVESDTLPPDTPATPTFPDVCEGGQVALSWLAVADNGSPASGVAGYEISIKNTETLAETIVDVGNVLTYVVHNLDVGTIYSVKVRAYDAAAIPNYSAWSVADEVKPCGVGDLFDPHDDWVEPPMGDQWNKRCFVESVMVLRIPGIRDDSV